MECAICMLPMNPGTFTTTLCNHNFHKNCLCAWFNSRIEEPATCPLCRADIKYDKGVINYWDTNRKILKRIENPTGDYFFYRNGKRKYSLKINRKENNRVIGGEIYSRFRFDNKIIVTPDLINKHYDKLEKMIQDENYDIFDDLSKF